ncbi:MAG: hypothetical protein J6W28_00350 [Clostridia bacterium]|nr:hypothetical protein [Clostridia bacterium]
MKKILCLVLFLFLLGFSSCGKAPGTGPAEYKYSLNFDGNTFSSCIDVENTETKDYAHHEAGELQPFWVKDSQGNDRLFYFCKLRRLDPFGRGEFFWIFVVTDEKETYVKTNYLADEFPHKKNWELCTNEVSPTTIKDLLDLTY